jgi:branched-chain amino acid transport system ATP-binding protein
MHTESLSKRFGGLAAVAGVGITLNVGEIHAVIGPNGAGKSTLVNLLSGDLKPTGGEVYLAGKRVTPLGPDRRGRAGIGRSYQKTTIFPDFSAAENVRLAVQAHMPYPLALFRQADADAEINAHAGAALATVGLSARASVRASTLSHGEQRQLEIAMALATKPRMLLLDEPMAGMGPNESARMVKTLRELKSELTILLIEHDMEAVFALADRITVLVYGRIIATGAPEAIRANAQVQQAYLGENEPTVAGHG